MSRFSNYLIATPKITFPTTEEKLAQWGATKNRNSPNTSRIGMYIIQLGSHLQRTYNDGTGPEAVAYVLDLSHFEAKFAISRLNTGAANMQLFKKYSKGTGRQSRQKNESPIQCSRGDRPLSLSALCHY